MPQRARRTNRRAMALLSTLAFLSLLTVLLVAFMSVITQDRQSTQNYSKGIQADQIASSGLARIVSQLQTEIANTNNAARVARLVNASVPASAAYPVYRPMTGPATLPERMANLPADAALQAIVKASLPGAPFYTTPDITGTNPASSALTTSNSLNGRSVGLRRWDLPQLVPTTATNHFPVPRWVLLGRQGPVLPSGADLSGALGNRDAVLGRYAYVVYDVSGLIDINVAGYPSTAGTKAGGKGLLPWADLTQLTNTLAQSDVDALVTWRNAANAANYAAYVTNWSTNGFLRVARGDTTFMGRQDLLQFASRPGNAKWAAVLPYLTTFSRELNGPVWGPAANAPYGPPFDYLAHQYGPTTATKSVPNTYASTTVYDDNVFLLNPRVQTTYTNAFGIVRKAGEPLVKYRFPLDKLALLEATTNTATWTANKAEIQKYFGLDYVTTGADPSSDLFRHWSYPTANAAYGYGGVANRILTLDEVAKLQRDPNFFELLQAGILSGSLGKDGRADYIPSNIPAGAPDPDTVPAYQLIRIGANIIDQWDSDSCPTTVTFNGIDFYGVEDLPYISKATAKCYASASVSTATTGTIQPLLYFELWNPHQNAGTSATGRPANFELAPSVNNNDSFYVNIDQGVYTTAVGTYTGPAANARWTATWQYNGTSTGNSIAYTNAVVPNNGRMGFTAAVGDYRNPSLIPASSINSAVDPTGKTVLSPGYVMNSNPKVTGQEKDRGVAVLGLLLPSVSLPTAGRLASSGVTSGPGSAWPPNVAPGTNPLWFFVLAGAPVYLLQYEWPPGSGSYHAYGTLAGTDSAGGWGLNMSVWQAPVWSASANQMANAKGDPRSSRWGASSFYYNRLADTPCMAGNTLYPSSGAGTAYNGVTATLPFASPAANSAAPYRMDLWSVNTNATAFTGPSPYYADKDGTQRLGDNAFSYPTGHSPFYEAAAGGDASRPILLNRRFTSVGNLGYAYRDTPWKSLNFFSGDSADAALLDLFTLSEGPVVAGRVNPNTAPVPVLRALLGGADLGSGGGASPSLNSAAAATVAADFRNVATNSFFFSRADVVGKFMGTNSVVSGLAGVSPDGLKTEREAVVRSLAETANTRTWNLMIDLVAQSGRYPAGTTAPENFLVEGERRYWLHLAIDRYTGEIVDRQLEAVSE